VPNVRLFLNKKKMLYVLKNHIPLVLHEDDDEEVRMKYECHIDDDDND